MNETMPTLNPEHWMKFPMLVGENIREPIFQLHDYDPAEVLQEIPITFLKRVPIEKLCPDNVEDFVRF